MLCRRWFKHIYLSWNYYFREMKSCEIWWLFLLFYNTKQWKALPYFLDNLLQPIDKQSLLDSGIFCCLIHILNALLDPDEASQRAKTASYEEKSVLGEDLNGHGGQGRRLEVTSIFSHWESENIFLILFFVLLC